MIKIEVFKVGRLRTNCYLVSDSETGHAFIVDPGGEIKDFEEKVSGKYKVDYILITHGHFDHILNVEKYKNLTGAKVVISEKEEEFINDSSLNLSSRFLKSSEIKSFVPDILVKDEDEIPFGSRKIKVLSTPGHTKGGVCYILEDNIFSGDTLFFRDYGSYDFPSGSKEELLNSLRKLSKLEGEFNVYPGHNKATSLSFEKSFIKNL